MSMPKTGSEGHVAVQDSHSILSPAALAIRTTSLAKTAIPADAVRTLPGEFVKRHLVLPLQLYNGTLEVATAQLGNQRVIDDIRLLSGLEV